MSSKTESAPPTSRRRRYSTRLIMTAAAIGAGMGIIILPLEYVVLAIEGSLPVVATITYGIWGMAALIPLALLRRMGVGVIGSVVAGLISSFSPYGLFMVIEMLLWGVLMELPYLITRYRFFGPRMFTISGLVVGAVSCALSSIELNFGAMTTGVVIAVIVVQIASFAACGLLSWAIARGLQRAGIAGGRRDRGTTAA